MRSCFLFVGDLSYVSLKCHSSCSAIGMDHIVCLDPTLSNTGSVAELCVDWFESQWLILPCYIKLSSQRFCDIVLSGMILACAGPQLEKM
jgi:hypothetical protein